MIDVHDKEYCDAFLDIYLGIGIRCGLIKGHEGEHTHFWK